MGWGKVWSNQKENDSEEKMILVWEQLDEEPIHEDNKDEEHNINGEAMVTGSVVTI